MRRPVARVRVRPYSRKDALSLTLSFTANTTKVQKGGEENIHEPKRFLHKGEPTATTVVTRDGEVTLTGIAKNAAERSLVSKLVTDIQGVTTVKNQMTVDEVKTL